MLGASKQVRGTAMASTTPATSNWLTLATGSVDSPGGLLRRLTAVGEVLFVLLALVVVARLLFSWLGLVDADQYLFPADGAPDFRAAAGAEASWHALRYGIVLLAVLVIGWVRWRRRPAHYAVTRGGRSLSALVTFGLVLYAVTHLPTELLGMADRAFDLGPGLPFWNLMEEVPWNGDFWLFMAVSSFLIVPLVEEFTARGYLLGRLRESFSPAGALVVMAALFAVAHTQYHRADLLSVASLCTLFYGSVLWGYAVYRTGSLIPPIIAHALVNVPVAPEFAPYLLLVLVLTIVAGRRAISACARQLGSLFAEAKDWAPVAAICGLLIVFGWSLKAASYVPYLWLLAFLGLFVASLRTPSAWRAIPERAAAQAADQ